MFFLPYSTEVVLSRLPFANILIMLLCSGVFALEFSGVLPEESIDSLALSSSSFISFFTSIFLHGGILHLLFNMWFLWVFGNGVCERLGSLGFLALFLLCGLGAGVFHVAIDGSPAIGASGAIFGVIAFYLVMYPINKMNCFYMVFGRFGTFQISGYWMVSLWFAEDIYSALNDGGDGVAHCAHIGGFILGLILGLLAFHFKWVSLADYDNPSLYDYMGSWLPSSKRKQSKKADRRSYWLDEAERKLQAEAPAQAPVARSAAPARLPLAPMEPELPKTAPAAAESFDLECPFCKAALSVPKSALGKALKCPSCSNALELSAE